MYLCLPLPWPFLYSLLSYLHLFSLVIYYPYINYSVFALISILYIYIRFYFTVSGVASSKTPGGVSLLRHGRGNMWGIFPAVSILPGRPLMFREISLDAPVTRCEPALSLGLFLVSLPIMESSLRHLLFCKFISDMYRYFLIVYGIIVSNFCGHLTALQVNGRTRVMARLTSSTVGSIPQVAFHSLR